MKNLKLISFLMILASSLMFIQCTSDPIEGPQGIAGIDGYEGVDGVNGDNSCLNCHNDQFKKMASETFPSSGHAIAANSPTGKSGACLNCHSNEGYLAAYLPGDLTTTFVTNAATATKITCSTCHAGGHKNVANTVAGKDFALRSTEPYKLIGTGSVGTTIDYGGSSNNCIHCHQIRRAGAGYPANADPLNANFGKVGINSHFGPHYGGAATMLEGIDGNNIVPVSGAVAYPGVGTGPHRTGASCTSCHMGVAKDGKGSHSFKPVLDNCKKCHTQAGVVNYDINGGQTKIKNLMKDLAKELVRLHPTVFSLNDGVADSHYLGMLVMPPTGTYQIPDRVAKSVFNYRLVYQDHSYGVHNPQYATALMKNSIADLKLIPTP